MEQVQRVIVEIAGAPTDALIGDLEAHREELRGRPGFRGISIARSPNTDGNTLLSIETRWRDNNSLADYSSQQPNVESIIAGHSDETVSGSLEVRRLETMTDEEGEPSGPVYERMAFALFVPIGVLVFALLVIYGLSRVYLALDPNVATPVAAVIALGILAACGFIAANPMLARWQVAGMVGVTAAVLLGGGIYAGVNGKHAAETPKSVVAATQTAGAGGAGGTPGAAATSAPGALTITTPDDTRYDKTQLNAPAGVELTVTYANKSAIVHNIHFFQGPDGKSPTIKATKLGSNDTQTITLGALPPGRYFYRCDAHPTQMTGILVVQ
ncbi:MAG: cupredoxin domain-containing protein [Dehalococcoidia bacterium]|nr:cupredoxin domain-containing protein [Dehalococcoidia bacterium]